MLIIDKLVNNLKSQGVTVGVDMSQARKFEADGKKQYWKDKTNPNKRKRGRPKKGRVRVNEEN